MNTPVTVITSDPDVRRALPASRMNWPGIRAAQEYENEVVIIATPRDCSPQHCRD